MSNVHVDSFTNPVMPKLTIKLCNLSSCNTDLSIAGCCFMLWQTNMNITIAIYPGSTQLLKIEQLVLKKEMLIQVVTKRNEHTHVASA